MTTKRTADRSTVVDTATVWRPVGPGTPRGAKVQLINRNAGVATYGNWAPGSWWTHWHPLPVFRDVGDAVVQDDALMSPPADVPTKLVFGVDG